MEQSTAILYNTLVTVCPYLQIAIVCQKYKLEVEHSRTLARTYLQERGPVADIPAVQL